MAQNTGVSLNFQVTSTQEGITSQHNLEPMRSRLRR